MEKARVTERWRDVLSGEPASGLDQYKTAITEKHTHWRNLKSVVVSRATYTPKPKQGVEPTTPLQNLTTAVSAVGHCYRGEGGVILQPYHQS